MSNFSHRSLKPEDAKGICSFVRSAEELFFCFPKASYPLAPNVLLAEAGRRHAATVAVEAGRVVGYVNFIDVQERRFCTIGNLVVDPARRRSGVGRYLVQAMVAKAVEDYRVRFVRVSCFSHNTSAFQLYHALGFKPIDMVQRTTPEGEPVLLLNLILRLTG